MVDVAADEALDADDPRARVTGSEAPEQDSVELDALDVVGIGSPIVDVLSRASDHGVEQAGLVKGTMALVDLARAADIYQQLGPTVEVSGGSAANTMAGVAALGGRSGFVGKIATDLLGDVFTHDIRGAGVEYDAIYAPPGDAQSADDGEVLGTGRCLVLVTEDGQRTMATHLGAASLLAPGELPVGMVARAGILYLEGYLWDLPPAKEAMRRAMAVAHDSDAAVALSLSDPFCVERHQREFLDLLLDEVDVLFGNEEELTRLFGAGSTEAALAAAEETGILVAMTRGAEGSVVVTPGGTISVPAAPVIEVVDTTGAGDLYAAGFVFGLSQGLGPQACAELGGQCAAEIISHLGARPEHDLRPFAVAHGITPG